MLIFTYKLDKYIRRKIFPEILLVPNNYTIKGSFARKIPYVTDIDVVNRVYPSINSSNIHEHLVNLIDRVSKSEYHIILVSIISGTDNRFMLDTLSEDELNRIRALLDPSELKEFNCIINKYTNKDKMMFFLNELIWPMYKIHWTAQEVINNRKMLRGGLEVSFQQTIDNNSTLLLQYYIIINSYPIGIDAVMNYEPINLKSAYERASNYWLKHANYTREYYYMLFPFRYYFLKNKEIQKELEYIIEKKFGLYKQLMVRIDAYNILYMSGNLTIDMAKNIVVSILKDLKSLPKFTSSIPTKIKEVDNQDKMAKWDTLLSFLYDEINQAVNIEAKKYFMKYLEMIPSEDREKFYLSSRVNKMSSNNMYDG